YFLFFFQAEDGIRDFHVTGVQTCALPICQVTLWNGQPLLVSPPNHVELKVVETDPGVRGDTAQGGVKPAKLETGAVVRVPLFIEEGEVVRVDTRTGEYVSRVKD